MAVKVKPCPGITRSTVCRRHEGLCARWIVQNRRMADTIGSRETLPRAFPTLTGEQIERIRPLGRVRQVRAGDVLFRPGDMTVPFFVLLSGRMEIVQPALDGERIIACHEPGEFTGEMTMISGLFSEGIVWIRFVLFGFHVLSCVGCDEALSPHAKRHGSSCLRDISRCDPFFLISRWPCFGVVLKCLHCSAD